MATIWNDINKPSGTSYTNISPTGKIAYDDAFVNYDDPLIPYDGYNAFAWTDIAKPTGGFTTTPGMATGLLMPPTYSTRLSTSPWKYIPKPT